MISLVLDQLTSLTRCAASLDCVSGSSIARSTIAPLDQLGCPKQPTGMREERAANALLKSSETAQDKASRLRLPRYRTSTSSAGAGGDNKIKATKAGTRVLPFTLIAPHLQSYIHLTRDRASVSQ
jgi:hypothetical protein